MCLRLFATLVTGFAVTLTACDSGSDDPDDGDALVGTYARLNRDNPAPPARLVVAGIEADGDFNFTLTLGGAPNALTGEGQIDGRDLTMTLDGGTLLAYTALTGTLSSIGRTVSLRAARGDTYVLESVGR